MKGARTVESFPPHAAPDAVALILGSVPGEESLRKGEYYAHPRNSFWYIMGGLFGAGRELDYAERLERLREHGLALWDVVRRSRREGSLDASIDARSVVPNDFGALYRRCPRIRRVFFNGRRAEELYRRAVIPTLPGVFRALDSHVLPSTSPAHAALPREAKLERWRIVARAVALRAPGAWKARTRSPAEDIRSGPEG